MDIPIVGVVLIVGLVLAGVFAIRELCLYERKYALKEEKKAKERAEKRLYEDVYDLQHQMRDLLKYLHITHYEMECGYKKYDQEEVI